MRFVQVVVDRISITPISVFQIFIYRQSFGNIFDETGNFYVPFILPWMSVSPMAVKALLNHSHLFVHGFLRIFLHFGVEGGVYFQTVGIDINIQV